MPRLPKTYQRRQTARYISALTSAIGAAHLLGLENDCKTLHELSRNAMGLNEQKPPNNNKPVPK